MYTFKQLLAEAIGTFFLCFAGIGAIVATSEPINSGAGLVGIALAHGLALSIAVSIFAGISGAHHQPGRDDRLSLDAAASRFRWPSCTSSPSSSAQRSLPRRAI